jgi:tetratricopeptide (TPR) repeat protein
MRPSVLRGLTRLAWLSLFGFAAVLGLQEIRSFDYWWHLRTGAWIFEHGAIPRVDPFTYTVPGARWIDVHWLHQIALHGLYTLGGHGAVVIAKAVVACALVALLAPIGYRRERPVVSISALALMLVVVADRLMPRPELPTFLCLAGVLALLERHDRRPDARVYCIVAIQLLWVNLHGLFALGVALCAIYTAGELIRPLVSPGQHLRRDRAARLAIVTLLAAAVAFANPNGLDGALYPIAQLGMIGPPQERGLFGSLIAELMPPLGGDGALRGPAVAVGAALTGLCFAAMALNWRRLPAAHPLLWVAFLYLALGANRNGALLAIVAAPILVRNANELLDARSARGPRARLFGAPALRAIARLAVVAVLWAGIADVARDRFFARLGSHRQTGLGPMDVYYPSGAADWLERERPPGPICHHMADGGYLIWRLHPEYPVLVDGRLEVFGEELFAELMIAGVERFRALDRKYHFGSVLVHYSMVVSDELMWWLYLNSNWRLVFVDDTAALFVRAGAGGTDAFPEVDLDDPGLFPALDGGPGVEDRMRRLARTSFLASMRRFPRALELWEETLERYPDLEQGPIVHAFLLDRNGFPSAAEAILRRLLRERPDDAGLLVQVGDLRAAAGDREAARQLYDAALGHEPNMPYALYRRAQLAERDGDARAAALLYVRVVARTHPAEALSIASRLRLRALEGAP